LLISGGSLDDLHALIPSTTKEPLNKFPLGSAKALWGTKRDETNDLGWPGLGRELEVHAHQKLLQQVASAAVLIETVAMLLERLVHLAQKLHGLDVERVFIANFDLPVSRR
jgi:hypothetical protein